MRRARVQIDREILIRTRLRTLARSSKEPRRKLLPKDQTMRPPTWNPPKELSASEQKVAKRIRQA